MPNSFFPRYVCLSNLKHARCHSRYRWPPAKLCLVILRRMIAELSHALPAWQRSTMGKSINPSQKIWLSRDRTPTEPSPSQANQCLLSQFLASLGTREKPDCASMLWSFDSCQNRVSADQYPWPYRGLRCRPSRSSIFEVIRWQVTTFKWS